MLDRRSRREVPELNRLYQSYQDRVTFYVVYIQEAHPTDLWQLPSNVTDGVLFASPRSDGKRTCTALAWMRNLNLRLPAVLDHIDNLTERAYTAWPDRMYLIDRKGRVAFKSAPGPYGFSTPDREQSLREITIAGT
ncbi:MAG: hypothetical protein LC130_08000 [Bryobacterales bacterium]|nr:hypothetical protein [Bryobacterales bacterium]